MEGNRNLPYIYEEEKCPYKVRGIQDENKAQIICALLLEKYEVGNDVDESEYCEELKEILNRGYFEIECADGVFVKKVEISKDWKPKKYNHDEYFPPFRCSKWDKFNEWFFDNLGAICGIGGLLLGICGLIFGLVF